MTLPDDPEDSFEDDSTDDSFLEWSFGDRPTPPMRRKVLGEDALAEHFQVLGELGRGGMGVVFRARDKASGREVALKILKRGIGQRQRERFRREGELTAALRHPGIVGIHSGGELGGEPFLAYELVEGGRTLADTLDELERPEFVALVRDVAVALGFAHERGVVHRDVKPENILIDPQGRPRITDFGLAWAKTLERLSKTGAMVGTPAFMAPEQFQHECGEIGPATDVWALGAVLYRGLTGQPQFDCKTLFELQNKVLREDPPRPRKLDPSIPADLEAVCLKALAKRPEDRYPDCGALAQDLQNAAEFRPVFASSSTLRRLGTALRRSRRALALTVTAVLALAFAVGLYFATSIDSPTRVDDPALRSLIVDFRRERIGRAKLERALDELRVGDSILARAHLALAAGEASSPAGWESRLLHAQRAAALDPASAGPATRAKALALAALGRHAKAGAAFRRAVSLGEPALLLVDAGRALLAASDGVGAERTAVEILARRPQSYEGLRLLVRAHIAQGNLGAARDALRSLVRGHPGPGAEVLRAEVTLAGGEDPRPIYARTCASWPRNAEARLALVGHLFVSLGEARAANRVLNNAPAPLADWRAAALDGLLKDPADVGALRRAPTPWRDAAAHWLLREGERELAFLERLRDPRYAHPAAAVGSDERRRRADASLNAALRIAEPKGKLAGRAHLGLARLEGAVRAPDGDHLRRAQAALPGDPGVLLLTASEHYQAGRAGQALTALDSLDPATSRTRPALWLRARSLLALDRPTDAIVLLEELGGPAQDDLLACRALAEILGRIGQGARARVLAERVSLLEGKHKDEASAVLAKTLALEQGRVTPAEEVLAGYQRTLLLNPGSLIARYYRGRVTYTQGRRLEGLLDSFEATTRDPTLLALFHRTLQVQSTELSAAVRPFGDLSRELAFQETWPDRLLRAHLLGASVEFERSEEVLEKTIGDLSTLLEEEPADISSWVMRGFLHLREGHWVEAGRDLRIAREAAPDSGLIYFYMALLRSVEGASGKEVRAELDRAAKLLFNPWYYGNWNPRRYPELNGREGDPELRLLFERQR